MQAVKGYPARRPRACATSARQAAQGARSGAGIVRASRPSPVSLARIRNAASPRELCGTTSIVSMRAAEGAAPFRDARKPSVASGSPSISNSTAARLFRTQPESPRAVASAWTNGRKPTPCTRPVIRTARRVRGWIERSALIYSTSKASMPSPVRPSSLPPTWPQCGQTSR